jgi:hypothetical protein
MLNGDIVTLNFHTCGGYVNAQKAGTCTKFNVFSRTTNNIFVLIGKKSFSTKYCLTQYGVFEFINSQLKLL